VAFYGDVVMPAFWTSENGYTDFIAMPTAIVRVYTSEGFVIGADGRCGQGETVVTDQAQKIFPIVEADRTLAYAFSGTTVTTDTKDQTVVVDLVSEIHKSVATLSQRQSRHDLMWYVSQIWPTPYSLLLSKTKDIGPFPTVASDPGVIAHVLFYGYYRKTPSELDLRFMQEEQKVVRPRLFPNPHLKQGTVVHGSENIANVLFSAQDQRLSRYRTSAMGRRSGNLSLSEGIEIAQNYIQACDSDEGRQIDPVLCAGIGGHIHIAAITEGEGFKWIIPPLEDSLH
jgi:hypothetical protein